MFDHVPGLEGCLAEADNAPLTGGAYDSELSYSPCDARLHGGQAGVYFLPNTTSNPNVTEPFQADLGDFLKVDAVEICAEGFCGDPLTLADFGDVREGSASYETTWKTRKNRDPRVAAESVWRVRVWFDADGDGEGEINIAYRDYLWTNSPSLDQPSDDPLKAVQLGSNEKVKWFLSGTFDPCTETDELTVTCAVGGETRTLTVINPSDGSAAQLNIGANTNAGGGTRSWTLTLPPRVDGPGSPCANPDLPLDLWKLSCVATVTVEGGEVDLSGGDTTIEICETNLPGVEVADDLIRVGSRDAEKMVILPSIPLSEVDCGLPTATAATPSSVFGLALASARSFFAPKQLDATVVAVGVGSAKGGGRVGDLSDFQLVVPGYATALPATPTLALEGAPIQVQVTAQADLTGLPETEFVVVPPAGTISLGLDPAGEGSYSAAAGKYMTGPNGYLDLLWTPGPGADQQLAIMSCGTAVAGDDTPGTALTGNPDYILGVVAPDGLGDGGPICDYDPADTSPVDGFANGPATGLDPFSDPVDEVSVNDLPVFVTASLIEQDAGGTPAFGARAFNIGDTGSGGLFVGLWDFSDGQTRSEANIDWNRSFTHGFELEYDKDADRLIGRVDVDDDGSVDYSVAYEGVPDLKCTGQQKDGALTIVVKSAPNLSVTYADVSVDGVFLPDLPGTLAGSSWTVPGIDPAATSFTVTGTLELSGAFTGGQDLGKLEVLSVCK